jgi:hypothetical protein
MKHLTTFSHSTKPFTPPSNFAPTSRHIRNRALITCSGICGKQVPSWVTPTTCRYCANISRCKTCLELKKKNINSRCYKCCGFEYPDRICSCGCKFNEAPWFATCKSCRDLTKSKSIANLIDNLGPIHPDYAVKIVSSAIRNEHCGYCSDSYSHTSTKTFCTYYFYAPTSFVDNLALMNNTLSTILANMNKLERPHCGCKFGQIESRDVSYEIVHKTPHMFMRNWTVFK